MKNCTCLLSCLAGFMLLIVQSAHAQIIFVPGSETPALTPCLSTFPMTRVGIMPPPGDALFVSYVASPLSGTIGLNAEYVLLKTGESDDLYEDVFYIKNQTISEPTVTHTLTMPAGTRAFFFSAINFLEEGDATIEVTSTDGTYTLGPVIAAGPGGSAVRFYGFYTADPSTTIKEIRMTGNRFLWIGRFGIYQGEYISPDQVATAGPLLANSPVVCAGQPVSLNATGTGNSFVITGPDNYVFSTVYRSIGSHAVYATGITQPGQYTLKSTLGCTESVSTITLATCP